VHLTPKEFDLLHHLMKHAGLPIDARTPAQRGLGPEYINELEYLRTFMSQLVRSWRMTQRARSIS
jgi:two-component system KDP operon response regulator KdpE